MLNLPSAADVAGPNGSPVGPDASAGTPAAGAVDPDAARVAARLTRNVVECLPEGALERRLAAATRPLRVKLGLDPTAADLHLGHTVVLQKLREFQEAGHIVVLIIGDYTARVGDPSGRSATRPVLDPAEIDAHARTYVDQATRVLADDDRLEVRRNSEWLDMPMEDLFRLVRHVTVAQLMERDDFSRRWQQQEPISMLELLYPVLQGYDSVAVRADVEIGGSDQKFNLLMGRALQAAYGQPQQVVMTLPLLVGIDGQRKMSKSYGNHVGIAEAPAEIYGRTLRIPDSALTDWHDLLLGEQPPALAPRDAKRALARSLVARFNGDAAAVAAEQSFDRLFVAHDLPEDIQDASLPRDDDPVHLPELVSSVFGGSRSEARRKIAQGGVRIDGVSADVAKLDYAPAELEGRVLQLGKRQFRRLRRPD